MKQTTTALSALVVAALAAGCGPKLHDVAAPGLRASDDAALIARGEYLFHGPAHCSSCHTTTEAALSVTRDTAPAPTGGAVWRMGPVGTMYASNLTPDPETGIARYTDEALARAIRHGVLPDGTVSLLMTGAVGRLADDDIRAILSYLRSLPPEKNDVPKRELGIFGGLVLANVPPKEAGPEVAPPLGPTVERGRYLAEEVAACMRCHSRSSHGAGRPKEGVAFAGGAPMASLLDEDPNRYVPRNLTPDEETGLGKWTEEQFVARFAAGRLHQGSPMAWGNYQRMHPDDVRAIWRFLMTLPPVKNDTGPGVVPKG